MKKAILPILSAVLLFANTAFAENYFMGISACPPWKSEGTPEDVALMDGMCARDVDNIASALSESVGIGQDNMIKLVQEKAKLDQIDASMEKLAARVEADDYLYVYLAMHAGEFNYTYKGYPTSGAVFALYTEVPPRNFSEAVDEGVFVSARGLRDRISQFARDHDVNVVIIMEVCHARLSYNDFKYNPELHLKEDGKIAVVFAAGDSEIAHYMPDHSGGRFTQSMSNALRNANSGDDLLDVFLDAFKSTVIGTQQMCNDVPLDLQKVLYGSAANYYEKCSQEPSFYDPQGLMSNVVLP